MVGLVCLLATAMGCATKGDLLRLQEKVADYHRAEKNAPDPFKRIAQLSAEVDAMQRQIDELQGELELARKESTDALNEVRRTRTALAQGTTVGAAPEAGGAAAAAPGVGVGVAAVAGGGGEDVAAADPPTLDQELVAYQEALDAWRSDAYGDCIDRFTVFLQSYPTSGYADDAAYWLADCTFKNEDYKRAVVRFNAVVSVYPESPKAPDALYRQGESLLKLGPKFHEAARTVFKRVQKDYPSSERAVEAGQQLDRLGSGGGARG
jgi:tol-pal system protein YbgF